MAEMKKYEEYGLDDFLKDDFFMSWLKESSSEKDHFWNTWLEKNPEKVEVVLKAKELFQAVEYEYSPEPSEDRYHEILENILKSESDEKGLFHLPMLSYSILVKYAAGIVLFVGAFYLLYHLDLGGKEVTGDSAVLQKETLLLKEAKNGQKLTITLSDGTVVKLNSGTKLEFPNTFSGDNREVTLEGEAFFDVAKNPDSPFIINLKDLKVTVLGTSFNIDSYGDENDVSVAVVSGKVAVSPNEMAWKENTSHLTKNQVLTYNKTNKSIKTELKDVSDLIAWKDKTLVFNNADLPSIEKELEKWFDVEIEVKVKEGEAVSFSGRYVNQSMVSVLEGICFSSNLHYEINDNKVWKSSG